MLANAATLDTVGPMVAPTMRRALGVALRWAGILALCATGCRSTSSTVATTPQPSDAAQSGAELDLVLVARIPGGSDKPSGIGITDETIAVIGPAARLRDRCAPPCRVLEPGGYVVPGFHDAHSHPYKGGALQFQVRVQGSSVPDIVKAVEDWAAEHPEAPWIVGRGWDTAGFSKKPHARQLDAAQVDGRPIALTDSDGHAVWTNTAALRALGVTPDTPDPSGGTIVRDADGPTGLFLEGARERVYAGIEVSDAQRERDLLEGQRQLLKRGFTAW